MALPTELKSKFIQILNQNKISHSVGWSNYMGVLIIQPRLLWKLKMKKRFRQ